MITDRSQELFSSRRRLSILLLCDDDPGHANTVLDHIAAFTDLSKYDVYIFNPRWLRDSKFLDLDEFDVVVIHYSLAVFSDWFLAPAFRKKLRRFQGLKIQFIQDDYRRIDEITAIMRYIGIHVLFTLYPPDQIPKVWDETRLPGVVKLSTLSGYIADSLVGLETLPLESRPIDVGYRGRMVPYWLGQFSQEKVWIGQGVLERAERYGLRCDIAWREKDRIYGQSWNEFISSCKAMLGTESGASITDFDGSVERRVQEYLVEHPDADFFEVQREILGPYEGNVPIKVISPRMFEAIALHTVLILFPGEYSGILTPWVHYIPLEKDFSNMDEVVEKLRDVQFLRAMTERAYEDIVVSGRYSFRAFIQEFDEVVTKYGKPHGKQRKVRYRLAQLESKIRRSFVIPFVKVVRVAAKIFWKAARIFLTAYIALKLILSNPALRQILLQYLWNAKAWVTVPLNRVVEDLVLLGIVKRAQTGAPAVAEPFHIVMHFDPQEGSLTFISQQTDGRSSDTTARVDDTRDESGAGSLWPALESGLQDGRVKKMVWDHSAIGTAIHYPIIDSGVLCIRFSHDGIHNFDALVELTTRAR